jgi:hypothetical protein
MSKGLERRFERVWCQGTVIHERSWEVGIFLYLPVEAMEKVGIAFDLELDRIDA